MTCKGLCNQEYELSELDRYDICIKCSEQLRFEDYWQAINWKIKGE